MLEVCSTTKYVLLWLQKLVELEKWTASLESPCNYEKFEESPMQEREKKHACYRQQRNISLFHVLHLLHSPKLN